MNVWRGFFTLGLLLFGAGPLLAPFSELIQPAAWSWSATDSARLVILGRNTLALAAGSVFLAMPIGLCLAILLFRTSFLARRWFLGLLILALFIPLPVLVSSWQGFLGANGWLPLGFWLGNQDRPWATGWIAALWIHTLAAIPWVTCILGVGLTWVEPELEEEALLLASTWRVLAQVTVPRIRASVLAALVFVFLQTSGDIAVTDMMLIPTLAEEVHTQFTLGQRAALARTLMVSLPGLVFVWALVLLVVARLEKTLPPLMPFFRVQRPLELGFAWQRFLGALMIMTLLTAALLSLGWKLGLIGHPGHWSGRAAWQHLQSEATLLGSALAMTLSMAFLTGMLAGGLALTGCWLARDCRWFRALLFSLLLGAWVVPAPVVGIGLHEMILTVVQFFPEGPLALLLYHGPSPLPLIWAQLLRTLPAAVVFLWPIVRMIPQEHFEAARLEGAGSLGEFIHVVWPLTWRGMLLTGLAMAALCLGEVAASLRVETPGWESFTKLLFDRMHYGVDNNVAALAVLLLGSLAVAALILLLIRTILAWRWPCR